jgi:atypical dual specificity phosphatase
MKYSSSGTTKQKSNIRSSMINQSIHAATKSKLFMFLVLLILCTAYAVVQNYYVVLTIPFAFVGYFFSHIVFEFFLVDHYLEASLGYFEWFNCVDDNLYLGAIPLENQDLERLTGKLGIKAVLSIVKQFELQSQTLVGSPVSALQWQNAGVEQLVVESPDFFPPSFAVLDAGANFLNKHLSEGRKCYCHCKSGKGRSASAVIAYLMKYRKEDVHTAYARVKMKRSFVFERTSSQMRNLIAYAEYLKHPKSL